MDIISLSGQILSPEELSMTNKINPLMTIMFASMSITTYAIKSFNFMKSRKLYTKLVKTLPRDRDMAPDGKIFCL